MDIPEVKPEWVGANLVTSGIPDLTLLPPSTRLQFPSGATLVVDLENAPCRFVADVIAKHHRDAADRWIKAATHKRGVTAWVEREGEVRVGDAITLFLPPQRSMRMAEGLIAGAILAGGRSRRMGHDKRLAMLAGRSLIEHAIARLKPQVDRLMINANDDPSHYAATGLPVRADPVPDFAGPLAGILGRAHLGQGNQCACPDHRAERCALLSRRSRRAARCRSRSRHRVCKFRRPPASGVQPVARARKLHRAVACGT